MDNTPRIETARLVLRRFEIGDLPAILKIFGDETANRFLPWFPLRDLSEAEAFYRERFAAVYERPQGYAYAICRKEDGICVGYIHADTDEAHDFGYALSSEWWRQGIASEAAAAVIERVRQDGLPFLTATHDVNNPRSGGVMRRVGMRYCYSYREQWQPKDFPVVFRMYQLNLDGREDRVYRGYWEKYPEHFVEPDL